MLKVRCDDLPCGFPIWLQKIGKNFPHKVSPGSTLRFRMEGIGEEIRECDCRGNLFVLEVKVFLMYCLLFQLHGLLFILSVEVLKDIALTSLIQVCPR